MEESQVELEKMLPAASRQSKERVWEVLEERGLSFLLPRIKVTRFLETYLPDELRTLAPEDDEEEAAVDKKCRTRMEEKTEVEPEPEEADAQEAEAEGEGGWAALTGRQRLTRERAWWRQLAEALKRQVAPPDGNLALQVEAVHALQLVWHESGQPKDFLLRCFMNLYELEVLEEDAFLGWREQLNPAYPDKGRALFQVNQWLTWLEEAEEEDSTDEE